MRSIVVLPLWTAPRRELGLAQPVVRAQQPRQPVGRGLGGNAPRPGSRLCDHPAHPGRHAMAELAGFFRAWSDLNRLLKRADVIPFHFEGQQPSWSPTVSDAPVPRLRSRLRALLSEVSARRTAADTVCAARKGGLGLCPGRRRQAQVKTSRRGRTRARRGARHEDGVSLLTTAPALHKVAS